MHINIYIALVSLYLYISSILGFPRVYLKGNRQVMRIWVDIQRSDSGSYGPGGAGQECKPIRRAEAAMESKHRFRSSRDI